MSDTGLLPTSSDAQNIGARAEKCFGARCPESWRPETVGGTGDFGIDYLVQRFENNQASDTFKVQLKGTTVPSLHADGAHFSIQLKASTIRYYARFTEAILLVLCDLSVDPVAIRCPLYYVWIHDELRRLNARDLPDDQLFLNLRVPKANVLDEGTDVSADQAQFRALARIGTSLDMTLEKRRPSLDSSARAALLEKLPRGFSERGAALMESLAEEPATVWPDRPAGSMAWFLFEADRHLGSGAFDRAEKMLVSSAQQLEKVPGLEAAEYWHLTGRLHLANLRQEDACDAFEKAMTAFPNNPKHVAAWAETKMGLSFSIDGPNDFSDILARLTSAAPAILSIKARILAGEKRHEEADKILDDFSGIEQIAAKAIIHTMRSEPLMTIDVCDAGLAIQNIKEATRLLLVLLKAKAQFHLAVDMPHEPGGERQRMPLSGRPNADLDLLRTAWDGMRTAIDGLRSAGWPANTEFVADILCATASILDEEERALAMLSDAAEKRHSLPTLQVSVESLAAQTGNFELAIKANSRQPQSSTTKLRKTSLLHMAKRDVECVSLFESTLPEFDRSHPMFGEALTAAVISADRLVRTDLVRAWSAVFDTRPELAQERAVWEYASTVSKNKAKRPEAINALFESFNQLGKPASMAMQLFYAFNSHSQDEAEKIVVVAEVLMEDRLFFLDGILQLGQAYTTLERWDELLPWAQAGQARFPDDRTLVAVSALALDRLGRSAEARNLLAPLIAEGAREPFVLGTHIDIATRCGFIEEAIAATEILVSSTKDNDDKIGHLRLLNNLVRAKSPSDLRTHDIAWRIGELTNPDNESDEGSFLMMLMMGPKPETPDPARTAEYQERLNNYSAKFPNSSVLRAGSFPEDATQDQMLETLMKMVGDTPETIEARRRRDEKRASQAKRVPFAWRPKKYVSEAVDLPQLWELSKHAKGTDDRVILSMIPGEWDARPWAEMSNRVPLMDLLSLLVAHDLNLFDQIFKLFPKVAVPQRTMFELGRLADPFSGSLIREKCIAIQASLQNNFDKLLQPRINKLAMDEDAAEFAKVEELKSLSQQPPYLLYSDDALFRIFCQGHEHTFKGICVLDVLSALEKQGLLSSREVAEKVGSLCGWGVSVGIEQGWQVASLPEGLSSVQTVGAGVELIRDSVPCIAIFNGMWDRPGQTYSDLLMHAAGLVSPMLRDTNQNAMSIASLMAIWHEKAMVLPGAPPDNLTSLAILARNTALAVSGSLTSAASGRLWRTYFLLVTHTQRKALDEELLIDAVSMICCVAATNDINPASFGQKSLKSFFSSGLKDGSVQKLAFKMSYKGWRKTLTKEQAAGSPSLAHFWKIGIANPNYWHDCQSKNNLIVVGVQDIWKISSNALIATSKSAPHDSANSQAQSSHQKWREANKMTTTIWA